jgi:hypothetical protein
MVSGGARARSGPAPDPDSYRSLGREWVDLPAGGFVGDVPDFPLPKCAVFDVYFVDKQRVREFNAEATEDLWAQELELWAELWAKPQAAAWFSLGLKFQVAAYVRAFLESVKADAVSGLKTTVLRMETELGLSVAGMRQNGWQISDGPAVAPRQSAMQARKTSSGDWLKAVAVEGA